NQQGVLTIVVMAEHGLVSATESPLDLSYLANTVVGRRYFEANSEVKQAVAVIKKRSGHHEKTIREFRLDRGNGIHIGPPLKQFHGILSGNPQFKGDPDRILKASNAGE